MTIAAELPPLIDALLAGDDVREPLERFVARLLADAAVWEDPRQSDGISTYRMVERAPHRIRVCGQIWETRQACHSFWLEVEPREASCAWTLHFAIDPASCTARRARTAHETIDDPGQVGWKVTLRGDG